MPAKVVVSVLYSMIHEVMGCGVIVQISPRTEERIWPGCLSSGLQPLISRVPGRMGPTPRLEVPLLDATTELPERPCAQDKPSRLIGGET
jgi:hypothetical protein